MNTCIALVTSSLNPQGAYSFFTLPERVEQTLVTLNKLTEAGFGKIFLFDNSNAEAELLSIAKNYPHVSISQQQQYQFKNKGLNEALLILNNLHAIPDNVPVFKLSGRYYPAADFSLTNVSANSDKDFIGVGYHFNSKKATFSTRSYFAKNKQVLADTLVLAIEDMMSYSSGLHGPGSLFLSLRSAMQNHIGSHYQLAIEHSFARILKKKNSYHLLPRIGIEGYVAGSDHLEKITE